MALPSGLQQVLPNYDLTKRHARSVRASPDQTMAAFLTLPLHEVSVARLLFAARSLPARLAGRGANLPSVPDEPLLNQFLAAGFTVLHEQVSREIVLGVIAQMWRRGGRVVRPAGLADFVRFDEPGFVKVAVNFAVTGRGDTSWAVTETRVHATDAAARRAFARYWLLIRPFSGLIRRVWLRAVAARAQSVSHPPASGGAPRRTRRSWRPSSPARERPRSLWTRTS